MRKGTSASFSRRYEAVQLSLATRLMPNTKLREPRPETDSFQYTSANPLVPFFVAGQKAYIKIAA